MQKLEYDPCTDSFFFLVSRLKVLFKIHENIWIAWFMEEFQREYDNKNRRYKYMCVFWGHDGQKKWIPALQKWVTGSKLFFFLNLGEHGSGGFSRVTFAAREKKKKKKSKPGNLEVDKKKS